MTTVSMPLPYFYYPQWSSSCVHKAPKHSTPTIVSYCINLHTRQLTVLFLTMLIV